MEIEWTATALNDMAALDKGVARRVKRLHGFDPPEFRLRAGDYRALFQIDNGAMRVLRVRNRREAYR